MNAYKKLRIFSSLSQTSNTNEVGTDWGQILKKHLN